MRDFFFKNDNGLILNYCCCYKGGGGITCIIQDGSTFERAAVNISVVQGNLPPQAVAEMRNR